jgi:hypothetical protein
MIRIKPSANVQISQGSGVSGQIIGEVVSTAGAINEKPSRVGSIKVMKISGQQLRSGRLSGINQRLRGMARSVATSSD